MSKKGQRNWSHYNQRLKRQARVEVFVSQETRNNWLYNGRQRAGGQWVYSDEAVEACLLIREYFRLALRQTQGFVQSLLELAQTELGSPDFTTLSRRSGRLSLKLSATLLSIRKEGLVIAIDSTGLSLHAASTWNRNKHRPRPTHCNMQWRKLHVAIDVHSGLILAADYSEATQNDSQHLPALLERIPAPIEAVAADMAYDKRRCREAIHARKARQLIPPQKNARLSRDSQKLKAFAECMRERDDATLFIHYNTVNGDTSMARKSWKQKVGYHVRSRVETTFSQIKTHAGDRLTNRTESNRKAQALIKCVLLNKLTAC